MLGTQEHTNATLKNLIESDKDQIAIAENLKDAIAGTQNTMLMLVDRMEGTSRRDPTKTKRIALPSIPAPEGYEWTPRPGGDWDLTPCPVAAATCTPKLPTKCKQGDLSLGTMQSSYCDADGVWKPLNGPLVLDRWYQTVDNAPEVAK